MNLGIAQIIQGNSLNLPLPDNSVDLICTSPPYFGLRSYQDGGAHYDGQIGSEATPTEFLDALLAATREMVRVLKPSGSIFVNLGDKYAGGAGDQGGTGRRVGTDGYQYRGGKSDAKNLAPTVQGIKYEWGGIRPKSLMGIPWRYAIRCIDDLSLILRAEIIWNKPNGLPESVTDRVRRSHEQWFHMVKQPRYFSAVDEIREPVSEPDRISAKTEGGGNRRGGKANNGFGLEGIRDRVYNPLGKLPGSVWTIPTQPLTVPPELGVDHFAAYPMEWPRRIIMGWTPHGICTACGEGRRPVGDHISRDLTGLVSTGFQKAHSDGRNGRRKETTTTITGYTCACDGDGYRNAAGLPLPPTTPAVCLDPFGGTGTTALVAKALGRTGITIDLSADYCRLAQWRCNDPRELAAALQVEKPDPVHPDQLDLFGEI